MKGVAWCQGRLYESQNFRRQPVQLRFSGILCMADKAALLDRGGRAGDAGPTFTRAGAPRSRGGMHSDSMAVCSVSSRLLAKRNTPKNARQINQLQALSVTGAKSVAVPLGHGRACLRCAYGLGSAPVASTRERRHLAMRHEQQG